MIGNPKAVMQTFLGALPNTISVQIAADVAQIYSGVVVSDKEHATRILTEAMAAKDTLGEVRDVLILRAAIDHVLVEAMLNAKKRAEIVGVLNQAPDVPAFATAAAGEPLRMKHFERALEDWHRLRANQLSDQAVVDYENSLLGR